MMDWLIELDYDITLGLNALHTPFLDSIMLFLSSSKVWIPLYVVIVALMFVPNGTAGNRPHSVWAAGFPSGSQVS